LADFQFFVSEREISLIAICPSSYTKSAHNCKERHCCQLPKQNKRRLDRHTTQIGKQHKVTHKSPGLRSVQRTENWSTGIGLVQIRLRCQSSENQSNSSYPSKFIGNTTKNSVDPLKIPLGYNMSWGRVRVSRNIIIRMSLRFWVKGYLKSSPQSHSQRRPLVFRIKVG
jgi:hypothetical protein